MTATVISLDSRRPQPTTAATCPACQYRRDGSECYPHRLDSLAGRLRGHFNSTAAELLVDRALLATALTDAIAVLDGITHECLPVDERKTP